MVKLMVPVVRDIISERTGIPSAVGTSVEVVKKIPKYSRILVSVPGIGKPRKFPVREDLYLVNAPKTRWMNGPVQCEEAMVMFEGYVGNDMYSAEELGL
jgi:hypothetical protein